MADKEKKPPITRKRLVGLRRERALNRVILGITGAILLAVVGLVGWGLYKERVLDPSVIVAQVEGEEITGREYQARVRVNRQTLVNSYLQAFQNYIQFQNIPELSQQALAQMQQLQFQLLPSSVGSSTVNQLVDDRLIVLEAQRLDIQFTEEDVERAVQAEFNYYPQGTPTLAPTLGPVSTSTLSPTQLAIVTAAPTTTAIPTASLGAEDAGAPQTAEALPTSTALPTATAVTAAGFEQSLQDYLEFTVGELGYTEEDYRNTVRANLYRQALFDIVTADVPLEEEQVWARHILVETEEEALALLDELDEGADWAALAAEHSLDSSNAQSGGDLGWFSFDRMVAPFAEAAFELEIGEISEPVETSFGWHLIQVIGHEVRPLGASAYQQARNQAFGDYVLDLRGDYDWEIFDTWFDITPEDPEIPAQARLAQ